MTLTSTDRPLLLGHRGARRHAAENTLAAFDLALQHGCDGFEFDVRRTLDARALICHDPRLHSLEVARHAYTELLKRAPDACSLEDVLVSFATRAYLNIELKVSGLEQQAADALRKHPPERGFVISSFSSEVLTTVSNIDPHIPTGFICDRQRELARWTRLQCDVLVPNHDLTTPSLVHEVHAANKKIIVWTVNQEARMRTLAEWGVDAIISDDTALLAHTFRR
ncbi:MAG: glycerophosphodiester phosphodiesterase [Acidobacteria bacterium]|nr:glycerophosphodiester phosphodiesterase [Acidobacteriota bacterium]